MHECMAVVLDQVMDRLYSVNPVHPDMVDIAENPTNVPPPITRREPATVRVDLETKDVEAHLDEKSMFRFWTFNGTVPGLFVRVRVGDTVDGSWRRSGRDDCRSRRSFAAKAR